ncbi:MAG: hypothetical protein ACLQU1_00475 [Bryobacteraceae bacterium]
MGHAIRFEKYDKNPVSVVPQEKEPPGQRPLSGGRENRRDDPHGRYEYVFPASPIRGSRVISEGCMLGIFGNRFRRVAKLAGVRVLRIHDLRHFAASTLTGAGKEDNLIGLLTGNRRRELRRFSIPGRVEAQDGRFDCRGAGGSRQGRRDKTEEAK